MDERIKQLRKALGLTQQAFADKLKIKRNTIAKYETGRGEPIDAVVALICREFNVNENWLRAGEGEMFIKKSRDVEIAEFMGDILKGEPDFRRRLISVLSRMSTDEWALLEQKIKEIAAEP